MKCSAADAAKGKIVIKEEIVRELYAIAGEDAVQTAEPMKIIRPSAWAVRQIIRRSSYRRRNQKIVALCEEKEIPWFVTGNGSNLVVSDEGYHGVILSVYKNFQGIEVEGNRIRAKAGSMLVSISRAAREAGLSGMEFASGIPGTLGGGVRMNAGAYGGEMKDIVQNVTVLTREGEIRELEKKSSASATVPASSKTGATSYLEQNLCLFREIKKKFLPACRN